MGKYSKILDVKDYDLIPEINFLVETKEGFSNIHQHQKWQYGWCLNVLQANRAVRILDVGGAGSFFALSAVCLGMDVTVVDPDREGVALFAKQNLLLQSGHPPITFKQLDFFQYQNRKKFDAVVCLGTLGSIPDDENFFKRLLESVKEGGVLFITVAFHPSGQRLANEPIRIYNQDRLEGFITIAKNYGLEPYGDSPDYSWKGENTDHYTFASLALKKRKSREVPIVLFVNHKASQKCGVYQYGKRVTNLLKNSRKCKFVFVEADSEQEYRRQFYEHKPNGIIYNFHKNTLPWLDVSIVNQIRKIGIFQISIFHEGSMRDGFDYYISNDPDLLESEICFPSPRPLLDYENPYLISEIPVINTFGFSYDRRKFEEVVRLVNSQLDIAILNLHLPLNDFDKTCPYTLANAYRSMITKSGIQVNFTHTFMPDSELLDFLAKGSLNLFLYTEERQRGCASTIDYALSVKRPIAITNTCMFRHIRNARPSICVEDRSLKEIMATGFSPLVPYYEKWRPAKLIEAYEKIVESIL